MVPGITIIIISPLLSVSLSVSLSLSLVNILIYSLVLCDPGSPFQLVVTSSTVCLENVEIVGSALQAKILGNFGNERERDRETQREETESE
jgi:hypothetical protein